MADVNSPSFKLSEATPTNEKKQMEVEDIKEPSDPRDAESLEGTSKDLENKDTSIPDIDNSRSGDRSEFEPINSEPQPVDDMDLTPKKSHGSLNNRSSFTLSEAGSGYDREGNECTEFCLDFCTCFGLFDDCCPTDGEGCLTTTATFIGNILFSCCKIR